MATRIGRCGRLLLRVGGVDVHDHLPSRRRPGVPANGRDWPQRCPLAAGSELLGVSRYVAGATQRRAGELAGPGRSFHRVEHVLMALAAVFVAYVGAGLLAHPDWSEAFSGLVTPRMSFGHQETLIVVATVGTTLAPWGLSFIQSYAVDKKADHQGPRLRARRRDPGSGGHRDHRLLRRRRVRRDPVESRVSTVTGASAGPTEGCPGRRGEPRGKGASSADSVPAKSQIQYAVEPQDRGGQRRHRSARTRRAYRPGQSAGKD